MKGIKKGDRYTNRFGKICVVKSIYKGVIKLQVLDSHPYTEVWSMDDFEKDLFIKIPMPKITRANVGKYLLEFQLNMIGKSYAEAKHTENWFNVWTMSQEQFNYFESYAIPLLKKTFRFNSNKAKDTFGWFNLQFGLKINN
jgi:hypothetical protein